MYVSFAYRNVQKSDDGAIFICIADNEGGETRERIIIHVKGMIQ